MTEVANVLVPVLLLCAAVNWYAAWVLKMKLYYATKPIVLVFTIALFIVWAGASPLSLPFLVGLGLSLLGDIFLIPRSQRWFLAGLLVFFLAHLAYIYGFTASPAPLLPTVIISAVACVVLAMISTYVIRKTDNKPELKPMRRVYLPYALVLVLMTASASLSFFRADWPTRAAAMSAFGALLFLSSDLLHAADRLGKRIPHAKFWIIASYHLGQFLIVLGAARWVQLSK